jgi:hypothetical protein
LNIDFSKIYKEATTNFMPIYVADKASQFVNVITYKTLGGNFLRLALNILIGLSINNSLKAWILKCHFTLKILFKSVLPKF